MLYPRLLFACLFLGFVHLGVTSPDQRYLRKSQWSQAPLVGYMYRRLDRQVYEGFRSFDLLRNPTPVSLIGTAMVDGTKLWIGCLRPSHFQLQWLLVVKVIRSWGPWQWGRNLLREGTNQCFPVFHRSLLITMSWHMTHGILLVIYGVDSTQWKLPIVNLPVNSRGTAWKDSNTENLRRYSQQW